MYKIGTFTYPQLLNCFSLNKTTWIRFIFKNPLKKLTAANNFCKKWKVGVQRLGKSFFFKRR